MNKANFDSGVERLKKTFPAQYNLYYPAAAAELSGSYDLFLRILPEPASRLYSGVKTYELRKYVPRHTGFVFLFETGGKNAVTGCFYFRDYIVDTVEHLWEQVGTKATSRERFDAYFAAKRVGVALAVTGVTRLALPISMNEIQRRFPEFPKPPEPYVFLYTPVGGNLSRYLRGAVPDFIRRFEA
jgi:predicted transcriptional regulator